MKLIKLLSKLIQSKQEPKLSIEQIAMHEAAHGIVWFLFRQYWDVKKLTIDKDVLKDKNMDGALQISPNFNPQTGGTPERANEITAIALAGVIGQNMELIKRNDYLTYQISQTIEYMKLLDTRGCGGDFELVKNYSSQLGQIFGSNEWSYVRFKIMDLIFLFQEHHRVQVIHSELSRLLIEKKSIENDELVDFFNTHNFSGYIYQEDLDTSFFHQ